MIVIKTVGKCSWRMEGSPQEIMEYEQLQERKSLAFVTELHITNSIDANSLAKKIEEELNARVNLTK